MEATCPDPEILRTPNDPQGTAQRLQSLGEIVEAAQQKCEASCREALRGWAALYLPVVLKSAKNSTGTWAGSL